MVYKKYSNEFKKKVVKEYLEGGRFNELLTNYGIHKSVLHSWIVKYKKYGTFPDGRGKAKIGRPKLNKVDTTQMTKDEYIAYLEMENDILKYLASLKKKNQK
jgi:transposase-like protein